MAWKLTFSLSMVSGVVVGENSPDLLFPRLVLWTVPIYFVSKPLLNHDDSNLNTLQISPVFLSACLEETHKIISILFSVYLQFIILRKCDASAVCASCLSDMQMQSLAYLVKSVQSCFYKLRDNVQPPIWELDQTQIGTRSKKQNTAINLLAVSAFRFVSVIYTAGKGCGKYTLASRNVFLSHGGWQRWVLLIGSA